ncbi:MAG: undecaprenyl-phosphate glucose phosphotransferase [Tannerellaceae bacterium]|jgi:putative colanic acid biosynthesis UDP-glucose lipid carrier transferase|nr:undecaprenyl-phosphate glucose phosphotransferase [Tannerellaceae bacterium]
MELINKKDNTLIRWFIGVGDLVVLNLLLFIIYHYLGDFYTQTLKENIREIVLLLGFCYFFATVFVPPRLQSSVVFLDAIVRRSAAFVTVFFSLFAICFIFLNISDTLGTFLMTYYVSSVLVFPLWHVLARLMLKLYRRKGFGTKQVVIVGAGKNGMELYRMMKNELDYGFTVLGFFDDNVMLDGIIPNYLGTTDSVNEFVSKNDVDEIYCTLPGTQDEKILMLLNHAENELIRFYIVPEFYRHVKKTLVMDMMESIPLLSIRKEPLQSPYNRALKRAFDIVFASFILLAVYPAMYIILGILIKLSSPGPVLFRQKRTGLYGKDFECFKFRTMRLNDNADTEQAVKNDPRKTKLGDFLRKTNLDEFPQFLNVLTGDMSVVGPRPHMLKHTEEYSASIDKYMIRHLVKPGITGWAQVTGYRGETKTLEQMEGRVRRDVWYIENWSFLLDLKIVVVTLVNMFRGERNAY